ncbi:MAG: hypothetical protein K8R59_16275 [Thermoanaerobaculales bacterium]|nr:hypothetical protein [Thermoanaerobaculales bacterium]
MPQDKVGFATAQQLLDGLLEGRVPRQVRLFAAQGLLPVSREDLFRLQLILSSDPDPDLAGQAKESLGSVEPENLVTWLKREELPPLELDLLIRVREDEEIWVAVAQSGNVSDETLRVLAAHGSAVVQDVVITNQVRVLGCLEILEDLKHNPQATQVVLRRIREFEEEFIEKAAALAAAEEEESFPAGPSIGEALEALRAIGAHIPREGELPFATDSDQSLEETVKELGVSAFGKILKMSIKEKILCAMKGTKEERGILINSRIRLVLQAVLNSPKLSEAEIEKFAASKSVSEEVIRIIGTKPRWMQKYGIAYALVQNPKAPVQQAIQLLSRLSVRDLTRLSRDRNINPVVRRRAMARLETVRR